MEQALEPGYKPPYYRNAFLCNAMVNMYMIDTNPELFTEQSLT